MQDIDEAVIEEFRRNFLEFLAARAEAHDGIPIAGFYEFSMGDRFKKLNEKYQGNAPLYAGIAIADLLEKGKIRFKDDRYLRI